MLDAELDSRIKPEIILIVLWKINTLKKFKTATSREVLENCVIIKFCVWAGESAVEFFWVDSGDGLHVFKTVVYKWHRRSKDEKTDPLTAPI